MSTGSSCRDDRSGNSSCRGFGRSGVLAGLFLGLCAFWGAVTAAGQTPPPCATPPPHLVGWWTLDETGPAVFDRALGNTGAPSNTASSPGYVDRSLRFNGVNSSVSIPDTPAINFGTGDFSIDLWLRRPPVAPNTVRVILDKRSSGPVGYHLFLYNDRLGLQLADSNGYTNYLSNQPIPNNTWSHVAVTVARGSHQGVRFYLNGTPGTATGDPTPHPGSLTSSAPLLLGVRSPALSGGDRWQGFLDEVELFNRVLQPAEVGAIYAARRSGKCKCASLKITPRAWWGFNEPGGAVALDSGSDPQGPFDGYIAGASRVSPGWVGAGHLSFNGTSDLVTVADGGALGLSFAPAVTGGFSVDAWINPVVGTSGPIVTDLSTDPLDRGLTATPSPTRTASSPSACRRSIPTSARPSSTSVARPAFRR